jgi:glycosyltransferase involved in cell wall biosynthesis
MPPPSRSSQQPAVWFPAVKAGTGTDIFTSRLVNGLNARGIRAEITWLPHHAEYAPWAVAIPKPPEWANICHINSWLHHRFHPRNLPIVATVHHCIQDPLMDQYKSPLQRLYHRYWVTPNERYSMHISKRIIADSHYTATQTEKLFGVSSTHVIHLSIDVSEFTPPAKRTLHCPFKLLYVGNWSSRKGSDLIAPILHKLGTNFELLYTGQPDKTYQGALPSNCKRVGPARTTSELVALYQQADALLFPTRLEGFGLVALEAQACGLPVVATRGSSIVEVVENGVTGILCEQDDVEGFVTAIRKLATQTEYWKAMSSAARTHAANQFPEANFIDAHISTYISLLADTIA